MPKKLEKSPVSFWSWFLTIFMIALPCVGFIYVVVGAFLSPNESRRNFYRAHLAWMLVAVLLYLSLFAAGMAPSAIKLIDQYRHEHFLGAGNSNSEDTPKLSKKNLKQEESEQ
jgi:hypothetical protein